MRLVLLIISILFFNFSLFHAQEVSKIEFHHFNASILFRSIDISFEPIKNSRKGKVRIVVKKDKDEEYSSNISRDKFQEIYNAIYKIKYDTVAMKNRLIDGSSTYIDVYKANTTHKYVATGLSAKSQNDEFQKDFWYAAKLILEAAELKLEDLIGYK